MSDLPQQSTINQYIADGVETDYTYSYLILLDSDINVYVTPPGQEANPVVDIKQLGTDYTVSGMGTVTGGIVSFIVPPVNGAVVTLSRNILVSIDTNFSFAQNFNGANLDSAFERVTLFTQQTQTILNTRALQYEVNTYLPNSASNLVPPLPNGYVWSGLNGAVVATNIETAADTSLLRSQLASEVPLGNGALLVGYYDTIDSSGTTVSEYLDYKDVYGNDTGAADAMVLTIPNSNFKYANGQIVQIIPANTNLTTTPTLNINGKGAILIKRNPTGACQTGDLTAGVVVSLIFDSSANEFYITNIFLPTIASANPTVQVLTGSGTYNPPPGCTFFIVEGVGGGGGGAGVSASASSVSCGAAGGGGGGYFRKLESSPAPSYAYAIGAGGAGGVSGVSNGANGGNTTFGTLLANGGAGGLNVPNTGGATAPGALGGTASGGDLNISGDAGGSGYWFGSVSLGGSSGTSKLGAKCPQVGATAVNTSGAGNNGLDYGCGGGGAFLSGIASAANGGAGSNGIIIVTEYYT